MKQLSMQNQKLLKTIHIIAAGIWLAGVVVLLILPLIGRRIESGDELYMYNLVYHFIDMKILTPAAVVTLFTGLIYSLFTRWGFFKHGWLIYKWIATLFIILTGTFYLGPMVTEMVEITQQERLRALENSYYNRGVTIGIWAAVINTALLIAAVWFSVYKPWKPEERIKQIRQ